MSSPIARMVQRARLGTARDLEQLHNRLTHSNFSLAIFKLFLGFIDADSIPSDSRLPRRVFPPETTPADHKATVAVFSLPKLFALVMTSSTLQQRFLDHVINIVLDTFDDIIARVSHQLSYGLCTPIIDDEEDIRIVYVANAKVLYDVFRLSDKCLAALYTSPAAIDVVIRIWVATNWRKDVHEITNVRPGESCPINLLMIHCTSSIIGKRTFCERITLRGKGCAELFLAAVSKRALQLVLHVGRREIAPGDAAIHLRDIANVVFYLVSIPTFQQAAQRTSLWRTLKAAIEKISEKAEPTAVFMSMGSVIHAATSHSAKRARNVHELLHDSKLISIFVRTVADARLSKEDLQSAINIIGEFEMVCHFPEVPDWMMDILNTKCQDMAKKIENHPQKELRNRWLTFMTRAQRGIDVLENLRGKIFVPVCYGDQRSNRGLTNIHFCDNPTCPSAFSDKSANSRQCRGCHCVVYCSDTCQKADWKGRHRKECGDGLDEYYRQSAEGGWYSHRIRAYHVAYIEDYYASQDFRQSKFASEPALYMDFSGLARGQITGVHAAKWDDALRPGLGMSPHVNARFHELFDEMKQSKRGEHPDGDLVRFVDAVYPWENHGANIFVLMKLKALPAALDGPVTYKVVYSVPRVIYLGNFGNISFSFDDDT